MSTRHNLLRLLADGAFHSGTALGAQLGVSRAAVHKAAQTLIEDGLDLHSVPGRGYRLAEPFVPLSIAAIRAALADHGADIEIELLDDTDSTSEHLRRAGAGQAAGRVCLAEGQSGGRGRRGRGWVATPFQNILLSFGWQFDSGPAALSGLSLAAGVVVRRALEAFGVGATALKWPNDILLDGRKLAGLLIDLRGEAGGPSFVVLGLGLNVYLAEREVARIDQPAASLREQLPGPVDRNRLAARLIAELVELFRAYERSGFEPYRAEWEQHHLYQHRPVCLQLGDRQVAGTVVGIDAQGGLQLRDAHGAIQAFQAGDVSLRTS